MMREGNEQWAISKEQLAKGNWQKRNKKIRIVILFGRRDAIYRVSCIRSNDG
jgi:hypothetical protein